jgi:hypothetical protein
VFGREEIGKREMGEREKLRRERELFGIEEKQRREIKNRGARTYFCSLQLCEESEWRGCHFSLFHICPCITERNLQFIGMIHHPWFHGGFLALAQRVHFFKNFQLLCVNLHMICDHMVKSNFSLDKLFNNELMFFLI